MQEDKRTGKQKTGATGESIAEEFLQRKGYKIIEENCRRNWGEIDIVAEKGNEVRFIEVKAVSRESFAGFSREMSDYRPEELVDARKLRKVARTAQLYMDSKRDTREFQIDVVGVIMDKVKRVAHCRLFEQALEDNL